MGDSNRRFHDLLGDFNYGMLVTYTSEKEAHIRPMVVARVDDDCDLWLLTGALSGKAREIMRIPEVSLTFQKDSGIYLVVYGKAELVRDSAKAHELWSESFRPWFPAGPEDPGLALIHVDATRGEYWDTSGTNRVSHAYEFVRGYLKGERPRIEEGDQHGKVHLS